MGEVMSQWHDGITSEWFLAVFVLLKYIMTTAVSALECLDMFSPNRFYISRMPELKVHVSDDTVTSYAKNAKKKTIKLGPTSKLLITHMSVRVISTNAQYTGDSHIVFLSSVCQTGPGK